jgi:DNA (cytosine-5)-methyltransferase 1
VPEFQEWGPVCARTCRPLKSRKGEYFRAWIAAIKGLGFRVEWRVLNCADHGDATTRERLFIMARSDGKRLRWPDPSHSRDGGSDLFGHGARRWRPAREIIDWSIQGASIFTRRRPLAPATIRRIYAGVTRFQWPEPYIVMLRQHMDARSIDLPLPTIAAQGNHVGLAQPILLNRHGDNGSVRAHSIDGPMPTADCRGAGYLVEPFVLSQASCGAPRAVCDPIPTATADGAHALIAPYYGSGSGLTCASLADPLHSLTARSRFGIVMPVTHADRSNRARNLEQPLPTLTTARRGELAFISAAFGEREGQAPRIHTLDQPAPKICAQGRINLVEPGAQQFDILFRMLQPHELAAAMGFIGGGRTYHFTGNKTEVTRQIGNAVPVNTAAALVGALMSA